MPYQVKKVKGGYKVGLETGGIMSNKRYYLSNKPLTFKQATAQKKAVSINEGKTCPKGKKICLCGYDKSKF